MSSMKGYVCTAVVDAVPLDNVLDELVVRVGRVGFRSRSRGGPPEGLKGGALGVGQVSRILNPM